MRKYLIAIVIVVVLTIIAVLFYQIVQKDTDEEQSLVDTEAANEDEIPQPPICFYKDEVYMVGEKFSVEGEGNCTCNEDLVVVCNK